jgi:hypothetical protein
MMASATAMSTTASACHPGEAAEASAAGPALRSAARGPVAGTGLGVAVELTPGGRSAGLPVPVRVLVALFRFGAAPAAGVMTGNRPAAFPAAMTMVMMRFRAAAGIAAAGGTAGNRPAALSALMIIPVTVGMAGTGPGGSAEPDRDPPAASAERAGEARADGVRDADRAALTLDEGDRVGLSLRVGDGDAEWVGVTLADGDSDAEWVGVTLADGDGVADADGDGDVDGDADVVEGNGEAEVAGDDEPVADGRGELEADETGLASAASWTPADSPQTSRPPVTRPAATTRVCAKDVLMVLPAFASATPARHGRQRTGSLTAWLQEWLPYAAQDESCPWTI